MGHRLDALVVAMLVVSSDAAWAQWTENGVPVANAPGERTSPAIVPDGQGGVFVAWLYHVRPLNAATPRNVLLQRIGTDGRPALGWPEEGLSIGAARTGPPLIAADGAGGVYVAWYGGEPVAPTTHLQRVSGSGSIAPGWPAEGMTLPFVIQSPYPGSVLPDGAGGLFILWPYRYYYTEPHGFSYFRTDWFLQRLTSSGAIAPGWPVAGRGAVDDQDDVPFVVSDEFGGIVFAYSWRTRLYPYFGGGTVTRLDDAGGSTYYRNLSCGNAADYYRVLQLFPDGVGGAIVSFEEYPRVGTFIQRTFQRFDPTGQVVATWAPNCDPFLSGTFVSSTPPKAASDGGSGLYMAWQDTRNSGDADLFAIRLDTDGTPVPGWSAAGDPVCAAPGVQGSGLQMTTDGIGGAILAWIDPRNAASSGSDVFAQRLGPDGPSVPGWPSAGLPVCTAPGTQQRPLLAPDGMGGAYVCWEDHRSDSPDIYLLRLGLDGPVPIQASLVGTEVEVGRVVVEWEIGEPSRGRVFVQKRDAENDWSRRESVVPDGTGRVRYEDRAVRAGGRYGYRLEQQEANGSTFGGEVWVDLPVSDLRLVSLAPNPSTRGWTVTLWLADATQASLEAIDLQGRLVMTRDVGAIGVGRHEVPLEGSERLRAGVYTLRLTQAGRVATARGVIVR